MRFNPEPLSATRTHGGSCAGIRDALGCPNASIRADSRNLRNTVPIETSRDRRPSTDEGNALTPPWATLESRGAEPLRFQEFFTPEMPLRLIITYFLAILEMARLHVIRLEQRAPEEDLLVTLRELP